MPDSLESIEQFLSTWRPFAELAPSHPVRRGLPRLLAAAPAERRAILAQVNKLYRLLQIYAELGIRRTDNTRHAERFEAVVNLSTRDFAAALEAGNAKDYLQLLQGALEFGRERPHPKHDAVRTFLLELWHLEERGPTLKYAVYPGGVLFSGGGKTHEEMMRDFVEQGYGSGRPLAGGQVLRLASLDFAYDTASTAVSGSNQRKEVADALRRWIRLTGGDAERVTLHPLDTITRA